MDFKIYWRPQQYEASAELDNQVFSRKEQQGKGFSC